ncbi:MAG: hypothetical protein AAFO07_32300, partial [Bacteroidota bacterium]
MENKKISIQEALALISKGEDIVPGAVEVKEEIDAIDAFHLRKNGVKVPDNLITYKDENLQFDEEIDHSGWHKLPSNIDETSPNLIVSLDLESEIREWLNKKNIDVSRLLQAL